MPDAAEVQLRGVDAARIVGDFAEIPALAVDVNRRAVHAVFVRRQAVEHGAHVVHVAQHVMPHQVEAEAIDFVLGRPRAQRIEHQLFHHAMLGRGVRAAGAGFDAPFVVKALIVAGDDPIQHRIGVLPAGVGVVVDHIHDHAQPALVERLHHLAEFEDALRAVGVGAVAAFRRGVVQRIVAPVIGVGVFRLARPAPAADPNRAAALPAPRDPVPAVRRRSR